MKISLVIASLVLSFSLLSTTDVPAQENTPQTPPSNSELQSSIPDFNTAQDEELKVWFITMRFHYKLGLRDISLALKTSNCKLAKRMNELKVFKKSDLPEDLTPLIDKKLPNPKK